MLFMHIERSLFDFTRNLDQIAGLGAQALRIIELWDAVERYEQAQRPAGKNEVEEFDEVDSTDAGETSDDEVDAEGQFGTATDSDEEDGKVRVVDLRDDSQARLVVSNLTLFPPVGEAPLLRRVTLTMYAEDSVLITGPSGTGKSTLLRTIGGLFARGSGSIQRTALQRSFFVPQNPYLYEGSLRDNVMYPSSVAELSVAE